MSLCYYYIILVIHCRSSPQLSIITISNVNQTVAHHRSLTIDLEYFVRLYECMDICRCFLFQCDTVLFVMGQFTSSFRKENRHTTSSSGTESGAAPVARPRHEYLLNKYAELMKSRGLLPDIFLVHQTPSSQYVDEDGDVAHEFYAEHQSQDGQLRRLCRVVNNLRPKGYERYAIPRLSPDVPVVMWEMEQQS
ncbi:hypothetical protein GCK32_009004 [Trichostrongylus colubriformis]|uniref:Uncharacterized protein n=1 Tax=Trichostrongylus colubriformis TaxID=6319 RepID=A0AAN8FH97_TRICO